jgi:hypothetical protein
VVACAQAVHSAVAHSKSSTVSAPPRAATSRAIAAPIGPSRKLDPRSTHSRNTSAKPGRCTTVPAEIGTPSG